MIQTSRTNPFRPGVGTQPLFLAGRDSAIKNFRAVLRGAPEIPANMRVTGLRGVGKTVLLQKYYDTASENNWFASLAELQPGHNNESSLKSLITVMAQDAAKRISLVEKVKTAVGKIAHAAKGLNITWEGITLGYGDSPEHDEELTKTLFEVTKLSVNKGYSGYILLLDEAQTVKDENNISGQHPLSMLIASVSSLQRNGLPIGLVLCGLPTLASNLLRARSYTERMFRGERVSSLNVEEALAAFTEPLNQTNTKFSAELAKEVVHEVEGYPYFVQIWGAELWDASIEADIDMISPELLKVIRPNIYQRLDLDFYEPRISTLTPAEQDLLLSTADCEYPPIVVSDLKKNSSKTPQNINVLLGRLVESGVLFRLRQGQYEYTAPKFREYLLRHQQR